jgi:hypothetical protein
MQISTAAPQSSPVELVERISVMRIQRGLFGTSTSTGVAVTQYRDGGPEPLLRSWKLRFTPDFGYGPQRLPGGKDLAITAPTSGQQAAIDALLGAVRSSGFDRITPDSYTQGAGTNDFLRVDYYRADGQVTKRWEVPTGSAPQPVLDVWRAAQLLAAA